MRRWIRDSGPARGGRSFAVPSMDFPARTRSWKTPHEPADRPVRDLVGSKVAHDGEPWALVEPASLPTGTWRIPARPGSPGGFAIPAVLIARRARWSGAATVPAAAAVSATPAAGGPRPPPP